MEREELLEKTVMTLLVLIMDHTELMPNKVLALTEPSLNRSCSAGEEDELMIREGIINEKNVDKVKGLGGVGDKYYLFGIQAKRWEPDVSSLN